MNLGTDTITTTLAHANLDAFYGPWNSIEEAFVRVPETYRRIGLTVGINSYIEDPDGEYILSTDNYRGTEFSTYKKFTSSTDLLRYSFYEIEEYLWKKNTDILEKKGESSLLLLLISDNRILMNENTPIQIKIIGNITPLAIQVYEIRNDIEYLTNYQYPSILALNDILSLNLNISGLPRTITYRIRIVDKNNQYARTVDGKNYVECIIDYKEIEIYDLNTNSIDNIKIKNAASLQGKQFLFKVGYISFITSYDVQLYIGELLITDGIVLLSRDFFIATLPEFLNEFSGQDIKVRISYTKSIDGESISSIIDQKIVTIIAKGTFINELLELNATKFYVGNKIPCRIYFEAEAVGTYTLVSTPDSDFEYNGRIISYLWNTIYITPILRSGYNNEIPVFKALIDNTKLISISGPNGSKIEEFTNQLYGNPLNPLDPDFNENNTNTMWSFILDMLCFINWTSDTKPMFSFGNITITKEYIKFGNMYYATPLLLDIHLGFEYLVTDNNSVNATYLDRTIYNALYINGVLCKNKKLVEVGEGQGVEKGVITVNNLSYNDNIIINGINVYLNSTSFLSPFTDISFPNSTKNIPIILNNYEYYNHTSTELNLPILLLEALNFDDPLYSLRNSHLKKKIVPSKFGTLEDGLNKYHELDKHIIPSEQAETNNWTTLLRLTTNLKKDLLKSRAVICRYSYTNKLGLKFEGYVEVHTQGTSTLDYRLPNFKFTFLDSEMQETTVNFVLGFEESILTAKTDYMDSSHLNNTPTATYYNKIIESTCYDNTKTKLEIQAIEHKSPSAINNGLDAIEGIPIIMNIKDVESEEFINYGSFMLNIDKTGNSLKFKVDSDNDDCISFEGTSNDLTSGFSSRFIIQNDILLDFDDIKNLIDSETDFYPETISKSEIQNNQTYAKLVNVLNYLALGLEYRYPDGDMIEEDDEEYILMPFDHFKRLFNMFYWVANSGNITNESDYKEQFELYFNYDYCALYFIFLMVFAQTDNLGKNCMFDLWFDPEKDYGEDKDCLWYPRPYDLDSQAGLNNSGLDIVAPFVEISPLFSLNYNQVSPEDRALYFLNNDSKLIYHHEEVDRYNFSSSASNLWLNFYKNYKIEIRSTYRRLRDAIVNKNFELPQIDETEYNLLSAKTILNFYKQLVLDEFGYALYNLDFLLKYLGDSANLHFGLGNRWIDFSDWITKRILFCDVYFYYRRFNVVFSTFNLSLLLNSPLYFIGVYSLGNTDPNIYFSDGINPINVNLVGDGTASSGLRYELYFNPESILEGNIYSTLTQSIPLLPLDSMVNLSIKGSYLSNIISIQNNTYLTNLTITNLDTFYSSKLPRNIRNITISNSTALLNILDLPYLESVTIRNCNVVGSALLLEGLGLTNPITLNIENSTLSLNIQNTNIRVFSSTNNNISELTINNCQIPKIEICNLTLGTVGFSGDNSVIDIIDFRGSTFILDTLDLSIIAQNVRHLLLTDTTGLITIISANKFENLQFIGLMNSEIQNFIYDKEGENRNLDHFDGKLLPDLLPKSLYCLNYNEVLTLSSDSYVEPIVYSDSENDYYSKNVVATRAFNLEQTNIIKIINLKIYDSNLELPDQVTANTTDIIKLFTNCTNLTTILNSDIICSGVKMFKNCSNLSEISNTNIKIGTDATLMFATCNNLDYSYIENILNNNNLITTFILFLFNKTFTTNTTIDLSKYTNALDLSRAFNLHTHSERGFVQSLTSKITLTFTNNISSSVTSIARAFERWVNSNNTDFIVFQNWDTLVSNCTSLTNMNYAFYACKPNDTDYYMLSTNWFPNLSNNEELSLDSTFASAKVKLQSGFKFKSSVINCKNTFYACSTSDNYTFDVSNIFEDCTKLKCAILCFYNNSWAFTSEPLKLSNANEEVKIAGIFSTNVTRTNNIPNNYPIVVGKINGNFTSSDDTTYRYNIPNASPIGDENQKNGIFLGRKVLLPNNSANIYDSSNLANLFRHAIIILKKDNSEDINKLYVQLRSANINRVFCYTNINSVTLDEINFSNISNADLEVELYNTTLAIQAFYTYNKSDYKFPTINNECNSPELPDTIVNASYMFYNLSVNNIPLDYFRSDGLFFEHLTNTSYMFCSTDITKLPYGIYGLLPNTITNLDYMFYNCRKLKGGIPNNFFNNNTILVNMRGTFRLTGVLCNVESGSELYMTPFSLKEQTPNVTDVSSLFNYNYKSDMSNLLKIKSDCFENCKVLTLLFYLSPELLIGNIVNVVNDLNVSTNTIIIKSPINMELAFVELKNYINFDIEDYSQLKNIKGIIHLTLNNTNYESGQLQDASTSIFNLLNLLILTYTTYLSLLQNVTLDGCFGKWKINTSELDSLGIPSTSNYLIVLYWYKTISTIPLSRSYIN